MIKKIIFILAIFLLLGLFYGLSKQIYSSLQSGKRLDAEIEDLSNLQAKNSELKKKLDSVKRLTFIEKQARDKLNLSRPGETIVIIPESELQKILGLQEEVRENIQANWQGWLKLFFR